MTDGKLPDRPLPRELWDLAPETGWKLEEQDAARRRKAVEEFKQRTGGG